MTREQGKPFAMSVSHILKAQMLDSVVGPRLIIRCGKICSFYPFLGYDGVGVVANEVLLIRTDASSYGIIATCTSWYA